MNKSNLDLVNFFYEIGTLRRMKRSYHINVNQDTESIAEHSHRVVIIAYCLASEVGADANKAMLMAVFHDLPETRTGDSNWLQKQYLDQFEEKAWQNQLKLMGKSGKSVEKLLEEYKKRESLESKIAKDADYIDYFLSLRELAMTGNEEAKKRLESENTAISHLYTSCGKKIAKLVKEVDPNDWTRVDLVKTHDDYNGK